MWLSWRGGGGGRGWMGGDGGEWEVMVAAESGAEIEGSQQG